jgi:hypothetical protein
MLADYVAYHSVRKMGRDFTPGKGPYVFLSGKSRTFLEKVIGREVWVVTGTPGPDGKTIFRLAAVYTPDEVTQGSDVFLVKGTRGHGFKPPIELNDLPWFESLYREQHNFSYGMSRIRDENVIQALYALLPKKRR